MLTRMHAFNLGKFVFGYKLGLAFLQKLQQHYQPWHSFVSAFIIGYFVFGENNGVNTQVKTFCKMLLNRTQSF